MKKIITIILTLIWIAGFGQVTQTIEAGQTAISTMGTNDYVSPFTAPGKVSSKNGVLIADTVIYIPSTASNASIYSAMLNNKGYVAILQERGSERDTTITVSQDSLIFGSYGSGANPVISGFTTVTGWTKRSNTDVYVKKVPTTVTPEILTVNGVQYAMGRTPNSNRYNPAYADYYHIDAVTGDSIITDSECNAAVTDWDGAQVVIRSSNFFNWTKRTIKSHSGTSINSGTGNANTNGIGFGYFIQNDLRTLDQFGEWYFNPSTDTLYFYGNPSGYTVKISTIDNLAVADDHDYITFKNIKFEGANNQAITGKPASASNAYNLIINNCEFDFNFRSIFGYQTPNISITNCNIKRSSDYGIYLYLSDGSYVANNIVDSTSLIPGVFTGDMSRGSGAAIMSTGNTLTLSSTNAIVEENTITNTGHNGINFSGDGMIVRNNYVVNTNVNKADGASIYYGGQEVYSNMTINSNILVDNIHHGDELGLPQNTTIGGHGVYLDYDSNGGIVVTDNTIGNIGAYGVFLHMTQNARVDSNTIYNAYDGIYFQELTGYSSPCRLDTIRYNVIVADTTANSLIYAMSVNDDLDELGTINDNYYATWKKNLGMFKTSLGFLYPTARAYDSWVTKTGHDADSYNTIHNDSIIFDYNSSSIPKTVSFSGTYLEADSTSHSTSYTLQPFESIVLFKSYTFDESPSTATAGQTTELASTVSSGANRALQFTVPNTGWITSVSMYGYAASGNIIFGIYSDNSNTPNILLATTDPTAIRTSIGWQTIELESPLYVVANQKVWASYLPQENMNIYYTTSPTPYLRANSVYGWVSLSGQLPSPFVNNGIAAANYSLYFTIEIE